MIQVVLMKINSKTQMQNFYLKTIRRQYFYSLIKESEVVLDFDRNNIGGL
jgi:hypothetical protein